MLEIAPEQSFPGTPGSYSLLHAGATFPGLQMIISNWVDDESNSRAMSFVYSGGQVDLFPSPSKSIWCEAPQLFECISNPA